MQNGGNRFEHDSLQNGDGLSGHLPLTFNQAVMLHGGKRIVEVMQECAPFLILRRLPETHFVVLNGLPTHEQDVLVGLFDAPLQLMTQITEHGGDDGLGSFEGGLKFSFQPSANLKNSDFENHGHSLSFYSIIFACTLPVKSLQPASEPV